MRITGLFKYDAWGNLESCGEYDESVVDGDYSNSSSRWVPVNDSYDEYGNSKHCYFMSGAGIDGGIGLILSGSNSSCSDVWWGNKTLFASPDTDYILSGYYCFTEMSNTKDIAKVQLLYYDSTGNLIATHESTMNYYSSDWEPFWKPFTLGGNPSGSSDSFSSVVFYDQIRLKIVGLSSDEGEYTGKKEDAGTGLKYFNARWYDSDIGRFITADTYTFLPGDERNFGETADRGFRILSEEPQRYNQYVYCTNSPVNKIDFDGHVGENVLGPLVEKAGEVFVKAAIGVSSAVIAWFSGLGEEWEKLQDKQDRERDRMRSRDAKKRERRQVDDALGKNRAKREKAARDLHKDKEGGGNDRNKSYDELKDYNN
jgi:RHS repeat-associated protein